MAQIDTLKALARNVLKKTGDTMISGFLTLFQDPTLPLHAVTKQYVDAQVSGAGGNTVPWGHQGIGQTPAGKYNANTEHWYPFSALTAFVPTTANINGQSLIAVPFVFGVARTIDRVGFHGAAQAGGLARISIYDNFSTTSLYPNNLLMDSGDIDCSIATGNRTATVNIALNGATVYWIVLQTNNNTMSFGTFTATSVTNSFAHWLGFVNIAGGVPTFNASPLMGFSGARAYAAMPATFPLLQTPFNGNLPLILARFSA